MVRYQILLSKHKSTISTQIDAPLWANGNPCGCAKLAWRAGAVKTPGNRSLETACDGFFNERDTLGVSIMERRRSDDESGEGGDYRVRPRRLDGGHLRRPGQPAAARLRRSTQRREPHQGYAAPGPVEPHHRSRELPELALRRTRRLAGIRQERLASRSLRERGPPLWRHSRPR